ncbi:helix-turn-helix domain-containing protein [uncultured Shimia sp.]|uniref:helix-turn-helix domain-containing protein n=1 Tax=uncultured Shimia sp. TaxID=573152 RepID=UPI002636EC34|nr:helix-turn-helix domain-containing protein [uncultured Shimia sp.]
MASFVQTIDGNLHYMYSEFAFALSMIGSPPEGLVTFNMMEPTVPRYWVRGHDVDSNCCWVFPVGRELRSFSSPGSQVHTLSVSQDFIARVSETLELDLKPDTQWHETFALPSTVADQAIWRMRLLQSAPPGRFAELARQILYQLLPFWLGAARRTPLKRPSMRARDIAILKGLTFLSDCDLATADLSDLRAESHVSERTLQYAFRERFSMSPAALLKRNKLASVRAILRRSEAGRCTVGDIASEHGFWHLGQFSQDYLSLYDERPSETLAACAT